MYLSHWGLTESPFSGNRDAQSFYRAPPQEEALARLHFLVDQGQRLGLLCGPRGSGKSLLLDVFANEMRQCGRKVAVTSLLGRSPCELLWHVAAQIGAPPDRDKDLPALWQSVADRIAENQWQQIHTVLLADDADEAGPEILATLNRLVQMDPIPGARWTMVLATATHGYKRLGERLIDRSTLRIDLMPWQPQDTIDYIQRTLSAADCEPSIVAKDGLAKLHELAEGIPRRINRLIDLALVAGAGGQLSQVDAETIKTAAEELVIQ
ncbi:MAG: AAA family ATPase [Pirellulales bacterium]|nr:AAA family ATPase [Pirellulales bacterium]